jgi:hypothetical protein
MSLATEHVRMHVYDKAKYHDGKRRAESFCWRVANER